MTVEDHPRYPEWRQALDRLNLAEQRFDEAIANERPEDEIKAAEGTLKGPELPTIRLRARSTNPPL